MFPLFVQINRDEEREKKFSRRVNHSPPQSSSRYTRDSRCVHTFRLNDLSSALYNILLITLSLFIHIFRRGDDRKRDDRSRKREYDRIPPEEGLVPRALQSQERPQSHLQSQPQPQLEQGPRPGSWQRKGQGQRPGPGQREGPGTQQEQVPQQNQVSKQESR